MLVPDVLGPLLVDPLLHPRGQPHISSASGLVRVGADLHVVADDEHHLAVVRDGRVVALNRLRAGVPPDDPRERKRLKPDLEALARLPVRGGDVLLALGSGSRPNRMQGYVLSLAEGGADGQVRALDLAPLYRPLQAALGELNIEGAFASGDAFCLLQRANRGHPVNACIRYPLAPFTAWALGVGERPPVAEGIRRYELGAVAGVPLGFTDGCADPAGGWIFTAVAEATDDAYEDGGCAGSAIGRVSPTGELLGLVPLTGAPKVEGVERSDDGRLFLVTDADDPARASLLLAVPADAIGGGAISGQ